MKLNSRNCHQDEIQNNDKLNSINEKKRSSNISLTTYSLCFLITLTVLNKFQFAVGFSGVMAPIFLYMFFLIIERKSFNVTKNHVYIMIFWFLAVISTMFSDVVMLKRDIITFLIFTLFFIFSTSVQYRKLELKFILKVYVFISLISSLNIIYNYVIDFPYAWKRYSLSIFGVYRDPNYVSAFMIPAIGLIFYKLLFGEKMPINKRLFYSLLLIVMTIGVLCTGSRAAFSIIGFVMAINLMFYLVKRGSKKTIFSIIIALIFIISSWLVLRKILPEELVLRLTNFDDYSDNIRIRLWLQAFELFKLYPLLGAGMEAGNSYLMGLGTYNSHNVYVDILVGQGSIGILLLSLIIRRFINVNKSDKAFMFMLVFSFFSPLFFINGFNTASFWTPMILCEIISNYSRRNSGQIHQLLDIF